MFMWMLHESIWNIEVGFDKCLCQCYMKNIFEMKKWDLINVDVNVTWVFETWQWDIMNACVNVTWVFEIWQWDLINVYVNVTLYEYLNKRWWWMFMRMNVTLGYMSIWIGGDECLCECYTSIWIKGDECLFVTLSRTLLYIFSLPYLFYD
jgi:hypothetical protein